MSLVQNLLILDEPTNHLDLHSKDVLLDALKDFGGTVVFVSHDRGFIQSLATRVLELSPAPEAGFGDEIAITSCGRARNFPGSYEYYLERVAAEAEGREVVPGQSPSGSEAVGSRTAGGGQKGMASPAGGSSTSSASAGALQYEEQKRLKNQRRKLEREEERLMEAIAAAEEEKQQLENQLAQPEVYSDAQKSRQVQAAVEALATKIDQLTAAWEEVSAQLEG